MSTLAYKGDLQPTRPINATRIKDTMYIFTGTYPLYYKGDGKLYVFPEHKTNFIEAVVSGHNTMMEDFDEYYYGDVSNITLNNVSSVNSGDAFTIVDYGFSPKFPTANAFNDYDSDYQISTKLNFTIPSKYLNPTSSDYFYVLRPKVFVRASSPGAIDEDYEEVLDIDFLETLYWTDQSPFIEPENGQVLNASNIPGTSIIVNIKGISLGLKDLKIQVDLEDFSDPQNVEVVETMFTEISEITFLADKISDYPTEEFPDRGNFQLKAPWTCNQVIDHYNHLVIWGSEEMPSTLFFSDNDNLNYFPSNYTLTFDTDLREPINSVVPYMNILVIQSDSYTWGLKGSNPLRFLDRLGQTPNPNAYQAFSINSSVGSIAPKAVRPIRNRLYFLSQEGLMELTSLFATDDRYNVKPVDRNIQNLIPQDKDATAIQFDNQYWINFPSTGDMFRYYIDKQAWVRDTFNFDEFNGFYKFYNRDGKLHIITHPMIAENSQNDYDVYEIKVNDDLALDLGIPVTSKFLTSKMNQDYPFHWKRYKELKMDFSIQNEYLPDLEPLEITNTDYDDENDTYEIFANFLPNHKYSLALNIIPSYDDDEEEFIYSPLTNLDIENASQVSYSKGVITFMIGNIAPEYIKVSYQNLTEGPFVGATLQDETYNNNLAFNLKVISDNSSMIRNVDVVSTSTNYNIPLVSEELGVMANTFEDTFENSQFGKSYKFVNTNKLYGSGYDLEMYYEDDANVKWTLETIGVTYKMRKTRSR